MPFLSIALGARLSAAAVHSRGIQYAHSVPIGSHPWCNVSTSRASVVFLSSCPSCCHHCCPRYAFSCASLPRLRCPPERFPQSWHGPDIRPHCASRLFKCCPCHCLDRFDAGVLVLFTFAAFLRLFPACQSLFCRVGLSQVLQQRRPADFVVFFFFSKIV